MPNVTPEQLLGNWGEQYIAEKLSLAKCLVRHVPQGRDVGIDLYCESVENGNPFLHFLVQVKTGDSYISKIRNDEISDSECGTPDQIAYLERQDAPVFIVVVSDSGTVPVDAHFFCPMYGDKGRRKLRRVFHPQGDQDYVAFIREDLPSLTYEWSIAHGVFRPIPRISADGEAHFIAGSSAANHRKCGQTLRIGLWRLSEDLLTANLDLATLAGRPDAEFRGKALLDIARPYTRALETLVETAGITDFQNFVTIGVLEELEGHIGKALDCYQRALDAITVNSPSVTPATAAKWKGKVEIHIARAKLKL